MDQPDLDALEQDVESARVRLAEDITRWRDPATMSEFKDTVVRKATSIKDEVVREASDTATHTAEGLWSDIQQRARANPWAALAIGAGLTWHLVRHPPISSALIGFGLVSLLRTDRSSAPSPLVTDAVEYAETAKEWAGTANRKIKEWREHAEGQAEEALTRLARGARSSRRTSRRDLEDHNGDRDACVGARGTRSSRCRNPGWPTSWGRGARSRRRVIYRVAEQR